MANVLYLVHRLPYPPDKGDKVRSYHLLRHLLQRHRVFLGTFIDDPEDEAHVAELKAMCPDLHIERINARLGKLASLRGLWSGEALSVTFYRRSAMHHWVSQVAKQFPLDASVVFSGAMAQFALPLLPRVPMLVDFVDVDSTKWSQYAPEHRWPLSWLYRREGRCLLAYERQVAAHATQSFFVTPAETDLFRQMAPEASDRLTPVSNGVNAEFFQPDESLVSPFLSDEWPVVFTGAMDYWPNVDGVNWFAQSLLPQLRRQWPQVRFYIVGRNPSAQVKALAGPHVVVTGTVPDVRPYLQHARAVVAPLRVARGIQNKILEAMAMGQPVVTVPGCAQAIGADAAQGLIGAPNEAMFVQAVSEWLAHPQQAAQTGKAARDFVLRQFSWQAHLAALDTWLPAEACA